MTEDNSSLKIKENSSKLQFFKPVVLTVLFILVLLIISLYWILATETGSRWLIKTAVSEVDQVNVEEINGTLAHQLNLKQLHYQESKDFSIKISEFKLLWYPVELLKGHLHVALVQLEGIHVKGQPAPSRESESSSDIPKIPLKITLDQLLIKQFSWLKDESKTEVLQLLASAQLIENKLTLSKLELELPDIQLNGRSTIQLQSDWPINADVAWLYSLDNTNIKGQLVAKGNRDRFDLESHIKGAVESIQKGFISLSGEQPEFNLSGDWQKLQWPIVGEQQVNSPTGHFNIEGTMQHYQARLNAEVIAKDQPKVSIDLQGTGNENRIDIAHLLLAPPEGQLNLIGHLSWAQTTDFNLAITAKQLNPANFGTDIPGKLDLKAETKGKIDGKKINAELDIKQLSGNLHGRPLQANGQVKWLNQQLDIQKLQISAGQNKLQTQGRLSEQKADLSFTIAAPNLKSAWPTLEGSLEGKGQIQGSIKKPIIKSNLHGQHLKFEDNRIANLSLLINYFHASKKQSKLDFSARNIQLSENKIEHISLTGSGNQTDHTASLELRSSLANLKINTAGNWNGKQWRGIIKQLDIEHPELKKWKLESPAKVTLDQIKSNEPKESFSIDLANSCLIQNDARLCFSAHGSPENQLDGQATLSAWPLAQTKPWLPDEMELLGSISAQTRFSSSQQDLIADINANITDGKALLKTEDNATHELVFTTPKLQLMYEQDHLKSQVNIGLGVKDFINAEVNAEKADHKGLRQLSGSVKANIANLKLIDNLVPQLQKLQGVLVADLQVAGNTEQPIITGYAKWQDGQFEVSQLGSTFRKINLNISSVTNNPEHLMINAKLESGKGWLTGKGHLDLLTEKDFPLQLTLNGEKFTLSRLPEAEVIISPELTVDKQNDLTSIKGLVKIDKAKIEIKTLPESAIEPSSDEVIINDKHPEQKHNKATRMNTDIEIQLGDNSHFSGFGLKSRLTGKLAYITKNSKQRLQGRVALKDATYRSYGQDLTIRKGEFLFNGPSDNPWLNIEAIRKATKEDVTAILSLTGQLKSPTTRIYTEPTLPESEALAYLITGKSMSKIGKGEGNAVANAALSYGVGQLSWISEQLGIDEFEIKKGEKIETSTVRLGQYLNPDLYIGVTMGLFAESYAVNLKYRLTDHININTRAGETQRIEMKYHMEVE